MIVFVENNVGNGYFQDIGVSIMDLILKDRENRYNRVIELAKKYNKPVVCGKLNYPGPEKNSIASLMAFSQLKSEMNKEFSEFKLHEEDCYGQDGSSFIMVYDGFHEEVKKRAVEIEEHHEIGRIFDIDVYKVTGESLSRTDFELPNRQCLVCENDAKVCSRSASHSLDLLVKYADSMVDIYL